MPEVIADVLMKKGKKNTLFQQQNQEQIGGTPAGGANFGASVYPRAIVDQPYSI